MASVARRAEVPNASAAIWERAGRMLRKESPYVEILYAILLAHEVLGTALAKTQHQQTILIEAARIGVPHEQLFQIFGGQFRKMPKISRVERFK